jgi:Mn-dependent DtxR family transcriptional regulator
VGAAKHELTGSPVSEFNERAALTSRRTVSQVTGTLAAMLGVARPSLNKVLKDLERGGLIQISYSTIEVPDPARLAARA